MKLDMKLIVSAVAFCTTVIVSSAIGACGETAEDTRRRLETAQDVATYEAEQLACVEKATTKAESRACRCEVQKRWQCPGPDRICRACEGSDGGGAR